MRSSMTITPSYQSYGQDLRDRAFEFACQIVFYCGELLDRGGAGRVLAPQLLRCGTSIGANLEEARGGENRRDFISKCSISLKKARESLFRLRVAERCRLGSSQKAAILAKEAGELAAILGAIVRNARRNVRRFTPLCKLSIVNCKLSERLLDECILRQRAKDLDFVVHHGFRHTTYLITAGEIGKLSRLHRARGDVRVRKSHFMREADRPRTVRSRRCREHLHHHGLIHRSDALTVRLGQMRLAAAHEHDGVHERHELVPCGRSDESDS